MGVVFRGHKEESSRSRSDTIALVITVETGYQISDCMTTHRLSSAYGFHSSQLSIFWCSSGVAGIAHYRHGENIISLQV